MFFDGGVAEDGCTGGGFGFLSRPFADRLLAAAKKAITEPLNRKRPVVIALSASTRSVYFQQYQCSGRKNDNDRPIQRPGPQTAHATEFQLAC